MSPDVFHPSVPDRQRLWDIMRPEPIHTVWRTDWLDWGGSATGTSTTTSVHAIYFYYLGF